MNDPVDNDLFDIPDFEQIEDESFPPLPPPFSPGNAEDPFANGESVYLCRSAMPASVPRIGQENTMDGCCWRLSGNQGVSVVGFGLLCSGEQDVDTSKLAEVPAARRRGVKRPQPKLDSQR